MAITFVNSVQNSGVGTSLALAFPGGHTANNLLALAIRLMAGITITSIPDLLGHDWSAAIPESPLAVGADHVALLRYVGKCLGGANTITINTSGSGLICAAVGEWSGFGPTGAALDQHNAATGTSTTPNSGTVNTTDAAEAAIGVETSVAGNLFSANGTPNAWSFRENSGTNKLQFYSQELATTQVGMNLQGTLTSDTWGAMIATFTTAPASPGSGGWPLVFRFGSAIATGLGSGLYYYWRRKKQEKPNE